MTKAKKRRFEKRTCWKTCPGCGREFRTSCFRGEPICDDCDHAHDEQPHPGVVVPIGMWHHGR